MEDRIGGHKSMKTMIEKFTMGKPKQMIGPVFWLFIESFFMAAPAILIYYVIDILVKGVDNPNIIQGSELWKLALIGVGIFIIQYLLSLGAYLYTYLNGAKHSAENKKEFIKKLRTLSLGYFMQKKIGEIINTFTGDFLALEQAMVGLFTGIFSVVISCIVTSIFMFFFNPVMAAAMYISIPIAAIVVYLSLKLINKFTLMNLEAKDIAATYLQEYLVGMKTLKSYNLAGQNFEKLKQAYKNLMKVNIKSETVGGSLLSFTVTLVHLGLPLMCFAGAYLILGGELGVVEYLGLIIIGTKIISPLITWVRYIVLLRTHYVSAERIGAVMNTPSMAGTEELVEVGDILFNDVTFSYQEDTVLENISFNIPKNQMTAIVGPSGGGKSTILRLIARFWDVNHGEITCNGQMIKKVNPESWIENISMVLQDVYLFHDTIRENILFGRKDATEEEMIQVAKQAQCHDFIMELPNGYETIVGEGGSTLSGGEKQRISIARALLKNAPILLLDEPTSSLDAKNEIAIQQAIGELVKGRTVIMIAHRLKTIQNAHQILVIKDGKLVEQGTHQLLMEEKSLYNQLWVTQNRALDWHIE